MRVFSLICSTIAVLPLPAIAQDLASWNDGPAKAAIVDFVTAATSENGPQWIAPEDRIATFDNDGTLWTEQPMYFQAAFLFDRILKMAAHHPEWKEQPPFKGVLEGDFSALPANTERDLMELVAVSHAGMTEEAFAEIVRDWMATARHPRFNRPYDSLVFQPMVEMLDYLRDNGFQTWIVSGGGVDFMRPWVEKAYGIPPQQVVGSQIGLEYQVIDGKPEIMRKPEVFFIDDKEGKPVGISRHIGKRPVIAFGNSDGDYQMLDYVTSSAGAHLGVIIHHTDAVREYAYDKESKVGLLQQALIDAPTKNWIVIDMAKDWSRIYPDLH
ncbi:HAD family hydrolase [Haematobacter sp.]|uniref:HAD family hydrolase n=1 Tax=Haematobacter sp. TaxID=2953762 RepID=UPI0028ACFAA0|nr:HAD family hydrolase [Haematobacter sp.]